VVYQQFENYVMVPRVFGNTLQVSSLSILVGVLVGGQLLGVIGIILSLPLTASIPVLERIWNEEVPEHVMAAEP
jgi:predicted PurR-regulated permease PerM